MARRRGGTLTDRFAEARQDYDAMHSSRFARTRTGVAPMGGGADYHIRNETQYFRLMEDARDMERNDSLVGKTTERAATNIVQGGFVLCPETGDKGLDTALFDRFIAWSKDPEQCDVAGEMCFRAMEQVAVHSALRDGDIIGLGLQSGQLQLIEGHRIRNPRGGRRKNSHYVLGVEVDAVHRRLRYHVRDESYDPNSTTQNMPSTAYDVRNSDGVRQVFHFYASTRTSSTRGVSAYAPVFLVTGMFDDLNFAKLVQAQVVSCFGLLEYQDASAPSAGVPASAEQYGASSSETDGDMTKIIEELAPGLMVRAAAGKRIEAFSPDVPNTSYFEHAKFLMSLIGINLGMPFSMMMLDSGGASWSGIRTEFDEARRGFMRTQSDLSERWHSPIYQWKVSQFMAEDPAIRTAATKAGIDVMRHRWRSPRWPYLQPVDEATGHLLRVRNVLTSPRRLHGELGQDWEEIAEETVKDNSHAIRLAMKAATELNAIRGDQEPVHWRELLSLPTPDGVQITMPVAAGQQPEPQAQSKQQPNSSEGT